MRTRALALITPLLALALLYAVTSLEPVSLAVLCATLLIFDGLLTYRAMTRGLDELNMILFLLCERLGVKNGLFLTRALGVVVLASLLVFNAPTATLEALVAVLVFAIAFSSYSTLKSETR